MGQIISQLAKILRQVNSFLIFEQFRELIGSQAMRLDNPIFRMFASQLLQGLADSLTILIKNQNLTRLADKVILLAHQRI